MQQENIIERKHTFQSRLNSCSLQRATSRWVNGSSNFDVLYSGTRLNNAVPYPFRKKKKQFCKFWYIILRTQNCSHEGRVDQVGSYNRLRDICQWRTGCCLWRDMYGLWCGGDSPVGQQHVARGDWMAIFVFPANNHTSLSKAFETTEPQNTVAIHSPVFHCLFGRS